MSEHSVAQRIGTAVIVAVLIGGVALVGVGLFSWDPFGSVKGEPYQEVGPSVVDQVRRLDKLASVEVIEYTTIRKGKDFGWLNFAREDSIALFAVAKVGAGIDLGRIYSTSFDVDLVTGAVTIELPPAEIIYTSLDNEETKVFDRDTGFLTSGDPQLESQARREVEKILRQSALDSGILEQATENAKLTLETLLLGMGYTSVDFIDAPSP
jgi:uncharacterized protein DUF4230